jgi:hypothetical protein
MEERALAIYSQNNVFFDERKLEERMVTITGSAGEHRINIRQAWKPDGKGGTEIGYGVSST